MSDKTFELFASQYQQKAAPFTGRAVRTSAEQGRRQLLCANQESLGERDKPAAWTVIYNSPK